MIRLGLTGDAGSWCSLKAKNKGSDRCVVRPVPISADDAASPEQVSLDQISALWKHITRT